MVTDTSEVAGPELTPDTVFFVGNGVLRVPRQLTEGDGRTMSPSWAEYMNDLWLFAGGSSGRQKSLSLADFSRLTAPRQAEWFDREYPALTGQKVDVATLRLHLLGRVLHRDTAVLSNPLLRKLANLIVHPVGADMTQVDVITTNVDCALEQNIAQAIDDLIATKRSHTELPFREAVIETIVDFRPSAHWRRPMSGTGGSLRVRLWKLHGCLRDLKIQLLSDNDLAQPIIDLTKVAAEDLCGQVPIERLASDLTGEWLEQRPPVADVRSYRGVFSQSEYFDTLLVLARTESDTDGAVNQYLRDLRKVFAERPLIFVGYSVPEVDVDVVYALQRYRRQETPPQRRQLVEQRSLSASENERLRQMGIEAWSFTVPAIGFAALPGKLRAARRHEWRTVLRNPIDASAEADWHRALERLAAVAWLRPQLEALRSLTPGDQDDPATTLAGEPRLVIAGLGSIWHGFALTKGADFPVPRRVSAQLVSVDAQVPGGSGLVPAMVAAAAAGPTAVGSLAFLSNVPAVWDNWNEIEDFCLSAGIAVHPWVPPEASAGTESVTRTSHIIFFDPNKGDDHSPLPRQRFIMDVQGLAGDSPTPVVIDWTRIKVPPASITTRFQYTDHEDFLFVDKESKPDVIERWKGPTVYETGASGIELVEKLRPAGARPTIWTAGVGSFVRTMVALAGRTPNKEVYAAGIQGVLDHVDQHPQLAQLAQCGTTRESYFAKLISFGQRGIWDHGGIEGFTYQDELEYGTWLRDHWTTLEPAIWSLLRDSGGVLTPPHDRIGGGLLTTVHEGGLMALWQWPDRSTAGSKIESTDSIAVRVTTATDQGTAQGNALTIMCDVTASSQWPRPDPVTIRISDNLLEFEVGGAIATLRAADPIRRNTLAAGDTVRGALAYGLWTAAYRQPDHAPVNIARIMLASTALATAKCYSGSFVDFLRLLDQLRTRSVWKAMWNWEN
ncbi:MAG TPA: hypothetical protein VHX38_34225 [Pseudonocardiaceae bacterium]|jgi:hypothetical protein|nr:hypothetical protein [Pseudonocardiaceae bacterium]